DLRAEPARASHLRPRADPLGRAPRRHALRASRRPAAARHARVPPARAHLADAGVPLPALTRYRSQQNGPLEGQASRTLSSTPRDLAECLSTRQEMTTDAGDE